MPSPSPRPRVLVATMSAALVGLVSSACSKSPAPPPAPAPAAPPPAPAPAAEPTPAPEPSPAPDAEATAPSEPSAPATTWTPRADLAVLATEAGLVAVTAESGERQELAKVEAAWCLADARAGAVWFTVLRESEGGESFDLGYVDMLAPGAPKWVAKGLPFGPFQAVHPVYGGEVLGRVQLSQDVITSLVVAEEPSFRAILSCEGRCHEEPGDGDGDAEPVLLGTIQDQLSEVDSAKLGEPGLVAALAKRAIPDRVRRFAKLEEARPVEVERGPCEDDEDACGTYHSLEGQTLGLVEVGNTRGDFLYRQLQLFDTAARVFVDHEDPTKTSATPFKDELGAWEALEFGPAGYWLTDSRLVHRTRGVLVEGRKACGWLGPAVAADALMAGVVSP